MQTEDSPATRSVIVLSLMLVAAFVVSAKSGLCLCLIGMGSLAVATYAVTVRLTARKAKPRVLVGELVA